MTMTFIQLLNNIESISKIINQKSEACEVLAKNHCIEEAKIIAADISLKAKDLEKVLADFDFENAEFE